MGGYVWPRGKRSWEGFAAHVGSAWVADTERDRWQDAPVADDFAAHWPMDAPLSPEEEEVLF